MRGLSNRVPAGSVIFQAGKGGEYVWYYADEFHEDMPDLVMEDGFVVEGRSEYYQYPYILRSEIVRAPEWFLNAVVYNIFPDSFADGKARLCGMGKELKAPHGTVSKSRLGGTIKGIMENLDYIQELGFTCLYLNPVFRPGNITNMILWTISTWIPAWARMRISWN